MVTGATAGIGAEFSTQLAKKGFNVVLIGRREGATQEVANEIGTSLLLAQIQHKDLIVSCQVQGRD